MKTSVDVQLCLLIKMVWRASKGRSPAAVLAATVKVMCEDTKTTL